MITIWKFERHLLLRFAVWFLRCLLSCLIGIPKAIGYRVTERQMFFSIIGVAGFYMP